MAEHIAHQINIVRRSPGEQLPAGGRAILFALEWPGASGWAAEESLEELARLADTAGIETAGTLVQRRAHPDPATFIGRGKLAELAALAEARAATLAICDDPLSPSQQSALEQALGRTVMDRTDLILTIFAQRAHTREAHLQVEAARLEYLLPRLAGAWKHLERQQGGIGGRGGPGETQIELDRRQVRQELAQVRRELDEVRARRARARQRRREGPPIVALVGYTNAGKSTLMNALTGAGVLAENKLFATLDPTARRLSLPGGGAAVLTDTVGFIQKLPTQLVAAFRATLEELADADLLLHVVDVAHPRAAEQVAAVDEVLAELGLDDKPVLLVLNKADLLDGRVAPEVGDGVLVSGLDGRGLETLLLRVAERLAQKAQPVEIHVPYREAELAAQFRREAFLVQERYLDDGVVLRGHLPARLLPPFQHAGVGISARGHARRRPVQTPTLPPADGVPRGVQRLASGTATPVAG